MRTGIKRLTYKIVKSNPHSVNYSRSLSNSEVVKVVEKAFRVNNEQVVAFCKISFQTVFYLKIWHDYLPIGSEIERVDEWDYNTTITISFADGNHGDDMFFDGVDGDLAHAYSLASKKTTPFSGHIHLDNTESWGN